MSDNSNPTAPPPPREVQSSLAESLNEPDLTAPLPPVEDPARLFAVLVGQMLEPIKHDSRAARHAAELCADALSEIREELRRLGRVQEETTGRVAALERRVEALERKHG